MSNTCRLLVAVLMTAIVFSVGAHAQASVVEQISKSADDSKNGWNQYELEELILLYTNESKRSVVFDKRRIQGSISVRLPFSGSPATAEDLLRAALVEFRLGLVSNGNFDTIIPISEACTQCETVSRDELADLPALRYVRIVYECKNVNSNSLRGAIQNLTTRQGGVVNPVMSRSESGALIISDFASNLIQILETLDEIESFHETVSTIVTLKNVKATDIEGAVLSAAGKDVSVGWTTNEKTAVLTGLKSNVKRIAEVVEALDVKQD